MEFKIKRLNGDNMMNEKMNKLFGKLWWYTDDSEVMNKFAELMMEFGVWNRSDCLCYMIDLSTYNKIFARDGGHIFFVYDDMSGNTWWLMQASDFIEHINEVFDEIEEEEIQKDIENIFYDKLMELID